MDTDEHGWGIGCKPGTAGTTNFANDENGGGRLRENRPRMVRITRISRKPPVFWANNGVL